MTIIAFRPGKMALWIGAGLLLALGALPGLAFACSTATSIVTADAPQPAESTSPVMPVPRSASGASPPIRDGRGAVARRVPRSATIGVPINATSGIYQETQARLIALDRAIASAVAGEAPAMTMSRYALAKAQWWLDVSYHEHTRNDRDAFTHGSLNESRRIAAALENGTDPVAEPTPLFGIRPTRPDLWPRMAAVHRSPGWRCTTRSLAGAEVEQAEASHALGEGGWRHANPYMLIAEDRLADAERAAGACGASVMAHVVDNPDPGAAPPDDRPLYPADQALPAEHSTGSMNR